MLRYERRRLRLFFEQPGIVLLVVAYFLTVELHFIAERSCSEKKAGGVVQKLKFLEIVKVNTSP